MESDSSETNLVIVTRKYKLWLFFKVYWRSLIIITTPLALMPVAFIGQNYAYSCLFIFLVSSVYWVTDVLHPSAISLIPLASYSIIGVLDMGFVSRVYVRNGLLDCLGVMMIMAAVENSRVHERVALKLLLVIGCSHYRLSLVLFFSSMFLSMWMSNTSVCGLMMPLVKALLQSLEKMGILEMYQADSTANPMASAEEKSNPTPTDYTVFYFLGIAYSCSIGGMATLHGSQTNQIFRAYCESIFPEGPKIEFPLFMLLNLPGVLVMETLLYIYMNSYFLKIFRLTLTNRDVALQSSLTEEEARYIHTLLKNQYLQLGKIKFHDIVVGLAVLLTAALQIAASASRFDKYEKSFYTHFKISAPSVVCVFILFVTPTNLDCMKFLKRNRNAINEPLPRKPSPACLTWNMVRRHTLWTTLFTIGGSCMMFEALEQAGTTVEFGRFLRLCRSWPPSALALLVIIFCKILTEFTSNSCVVHCMLPEIAKLSVDAQIHPHYLMLAATLGSSLPCHLITGTPANAMVSRYVYIPTWKMLSAGLGPSVLGVVVSLFSVTVWSKAIWVDSITSPPWANVQRNGPT